VDEGKKLKPTHLHLGEGFEENPEHPTGDPEQMGEDPEDPGEESEKTSQCQSPLWTSHQHVWPPEWGLLTSVTTRFNTINIFFLKRKYEPTNRNRHMWPVNLCHTYIS
jgi:hypothetical protein